MNKTLIFVGILSCLFQASWAQEPSPPKIIYILVDDLGYGDINLENESYGAFNNPNIKTPNLASLAKESLVFGHHYASSPVCSPSRAGLLTGRTPTRCNINSFIEDLNHDDVYFLRGEEVTIPELLKEKDYETVIFGKWHLNGADWEDKQAWTGWTGSFPKQQGFDHGMVTKEDPHFTRELKVNTQKHPGDFFTVNGEPMGALKGYSSDIISQYAIDWMEKSRDKAKPFFMFLSYDAVHIRIAAADKYTNMYDTGNARKDEYYANVTHVDAAIGEVLKAIAANGLDENTLVFFSSDNGPDALNGWNATYFCYGTSYPLYGQKYQLYQGGIRVPGMVRWKGTISPRFSDEPNTTLDVLPTLCDLAGVALPSDREIDGESIKDFLLSGKPVNREQVMYWQFEHPQEYPLSPENLYNTRYDRKLKREKRRDLEYPRVLIRNGDYILYGYNENAFEPPVQYALYNTVADPDELNELSAKEPDLFLELKEKLGEKYKSANADRLATSEFISSHEE